MLDNLYHSVPLNRKRNRLYSHTNKYYVLKNIVFLLLLLFTLLHFIK